MIKASFENIMDRFFLFDETSETFNNAARFNLETGVLLRRPSLSMQFSAKAWKDVSKLTNCVTYALNIPMHGWGRPGATFA